MRPIRAAMFAALLPAAFAYAGPEKHSHYLELINRERDSLISLEIADAGSDAFRDIPFGTPLGGGGESTTVRIAGEGCRYDLRFVFRDGRRLVYQGVDVCRYDRLRIRRLPQAQEGGQAVAGSPPGR